MRYNSERLDIEVLISGNVLLFKAIKISSGLPTNSRKMHALFRKNRHLRVPSTANNRIGHFRITFGLFFKASPGAHLFI